MKDIRIFAALAALALLFGCSRSEIPGNETKRHAPQGLKARATLGEGLKSHFGADGYSLVWDSTDRLFAFSANVGTWSDIETRAGEFYQNIINTPNLDQRYIDSAEEDAGIMAYLQLLEDSTKGENPTDRKGVFEIDPTGSGKRSATFVSNLPADYWFGTRTPEESTDDKIFFFAASYPAPDVLPDLKFFSYSELATIHPVLSNVPFPYYDLTVPAEQDGVSYQKYQRLCAKDGTMGLKSSLLSTDEQLLFNNFFPLTSILEFTLGTTDDISAEIASIEITLSTQEAEGADYVTDKYRIAGTVPFFFSWDSPREMRLWNRNTIPYMAGFGSDFQQVSWPVDNWLTTNYPSATPTLTISFDSPVRVGKEQTSKKYYAVVIPSRCSHVGNVGNPKLTFDAYNAAGDKILTKTITTSNPEGIGEGKKYSFDLTLDTYYDENVLSGLFSVDEGKQIYIARGNLQALWNGSNVEQWKIAQHQYDFVGASSFDLSSDTGWFDLFSFSVEGNNYGITNASDASYYDYSVHPAVGWTGAYPVAQGNGWRTITADEGVYLFAERENAEDLFSFGTIYAGSPEQAIYGLIFLPDAWDRTNPPCLFSSAEDKGFSWVSPTGNFQFDYSWNTYNADGGTSGTSGNWDDMQAAGAVFWPVAGRREGTSVNLSIGAYWSGTPNDDPDDDDDPGLACMLQFEAGTNGYFSPDHFPAYYGACVRLIKDLN